MRLLIDTHTLVWCVEEPGKLSSKAMAFIQPLSNDVPLSAATIWELAIKVGQGKLSLSLPFKLWLNRCIQDMKLTILPITIEYAEQQSLLPVHHKDPFDRMLIAQAICENVPVVSVDVAFDAYGLTRIW